MLSKVSINALFSTGGKRKETGVRSQESVEILSLSPHPRVGVGGPGAERY
jgi:hypothetical protein